MKLRKLPRIYQIVGKSFWKFAITDGVIFDCDHYGTFVKANRLC